MGIEIKIIQENFKIFATRKNFIKFVVTVCLFIMTVTAYGQKPKSNYLIAFADTSSGNLMYGYKTPDGKIAITAKYAEVDRDTLYNIAMVIKSTYNYEWIAINSRDSIILKPFIYDNAPDDLQEGLFRFTEQGKLGFANSMGEKIIPAMFDFVSPFKNGIAAFILGGHKVKDGEHWFWSGGYADGYINKSGQIFNKINSFKGNFAVAFTNYNHPVLINKKGEVVKKLGANKVQ